jgi:hypothetical protein
MDAPRLWVDFNDVFQENLIEVDLDFSAPVPRQWLENGQWIRLYDGEGNECDGLIQSANDRVLTVKLDFATLRSVHVTIVEAFTGSAQPEFRGGGVQVSVTG